MIVIFLSFLFVINRNITIFAIPNNNTDMKYDDFHKIVESNGWEYAEFNLQMQQNSD